MAGVRGIVLRHGREFPGRFNTLETSLEDALTQARMLAWLTASFSTVGLLVAAVGPNGLLAFAVVARTTEIGIRMALGASRTRVLEAALADVFAAVGGGIAIGVPLAAIVVNAASRVLFNGSFPDAGASLRSPLGCRHGSSGSPRSRDACSVAKRC